MAETPSARPDRPGVGRTAPEPGTAGARPVLARTSARVLVDIMEERDRQDARWGQQNHPDGTGGPVMRNEADVMRARCQYLADHGGVDWRAILLEEVYEALAEGERVPLRAELVQVAAVAVAWIEAIDRREVPDAR